MFSSSNPPFAHHFPPVSLTPLGHSRLFRAAPVRSGQAGAPQRGQGDGRKVVRTGGFDDEGIYTKVLKWNLLEFTRIYFFGGDYTDSQSWAWGGMRIVVKLSQQGILKRYIRYSTVRVHS